MKRVSIIVLLLSICGHTSAQNNQEQDPANENAVITKDYEHLVLEFKKGKLTANSFIEKEKLLISDRAPAIYNNDYVYHGSFNELKEISGVSLIPDKKGYKELPVKEFKTTLLKSDDVFINDSKKTLVTFSGLVPHSKTRLDYQIEHKDIHFLPPFFFQSSLPMEQSVYTVTVPKTVTLKYVLSGGKNTDIIQHTVEESRHNITHTWRAVNTPKINFFDNAPDPAYYIPHVIVYISGYLDPETKQQIPLNGSVKDLYRYYQGFIKGLNDTPADEIKEKVNELIAGQNTDEQKAAAVYKWVQGHIRYVAIEDSLGGFVPRAATLVYNRRFGDCKDMTSLLVNMLRIAGIKACFTWIGTRSKPYTYEEVPLPITDNHMICAANINNRWVFIDGTDPSISFGIPPHAIQGKEALIAIDDDHYEIVTVPEMPADKNTVTDSTHLNITETSLTGTVSIHFKGYDAWDLGALLMYRNEKETEETIKGIVSRGSNKFFQKKYKYHIAETAEKELNMYSDFEIKDYAQKVNNEWYINLNLMRSYEGLKVDTAKRHIPIEFEFMKKIKQVVTLDIPPGYHVSYSPEPYNGEVSGVWKCNIYYTFNSKQVTLVKEFEINTLYIQPDRFADHNKFLDQLSNQYKESIVLTSNK